MANTSDRAAATLEPAVAVEQLGPEDTQRIFAHFMALSSDDRARRFSYQHANSEWTMRYTRQIDFARQSLLALTTSIGSIVALLQICRFRDNGDPRAELAFSVRPDLQGRGLAHHLTNVAVTYARTCGLRVLTPCVEPDNHAMRAVLSAAGMRFARSGDDLTGVIEITPPLHRSPHRWRPTNPKASGLH